ncbi:MAG: DUF1465 family protein [Polymorphobacter sp.]
MQGHDQSAMESLYQEAVDLADQARGWFDGPGVAWRAGLSPDGQAAVAIESLWTTARLMAVMAWLLDPAQAADASGRRFDFVDRAGPDVAPSLAGQPGGLIAAAARNLALRVSGLAPVRLFPPVAAAAPQLEPEPPASEPSKFEPSASAPPESEPPAPEPPAPEPAVPDTADDATLPPEPVVLVPRPAVISPVSEGGIWRT